MSQAWQISLTLILEKVFVSISSCSAAANARLVMLESGQSPPPLPFFCYDIVPQNFP